MKNVIFFEDDRENRNLKVIARFPVGRRNAPEKDRFRKRKEILKKVCKLVGKNIRTGDELRKEKDRVGDLFIVKHAVQLEQTETSVVSTSLSIITRVVSLLDEGTGE